MRASRAVLIDLAFPLRSSGLVPCDHGYALYAAVTTVLPALHGADGYAVHPIGGTSHGARLLTIGPRSRLKLRVESGRVADLLPLTGSELRVGGATLTPGPPEIHALRPAAALRSRLVTIKPREPLCEESFRFALAAQLAELDVTAPATIGKRRTLRVKGREIIGWEVRLEGLTPGQSIAVQAARLGGRRHLGCGVFSPC